MTWPVAKVLDWIMGPYKTVLFKRSQLKALVNLHGTTGGLGGGLGPDEISVITGALDMETKVARSGMTPWDKIYMLGMDTILDEQMLKEIMGMGHSRIPVYQGSDKKKIIGLILVKELVLLDPTKPVKVENCKLREIPYLPADIPMFDLLGLFRSSRSHMAVLCEPKEAYDNYVLSNGAYGLGEPLGIITLEDVTEELLQEEIVDETDKYVDNKQEQLVQVQGYEYSILTEPVKRRVSRLQRTISISKKKIDYLRRSSIAAADNSKFQNRAESLRTPLLSHDGSSNCGSRAWHSMDSGGASSNI